MVQLLKCVRQGAQRSARRGLRRGFTLIELMIVVAILAILAATAVAAYGDYIVDARVGEARTMLADVSSKQHVYMQQWGEYKTAPANPATIPNNEQLTWDPNQATWQELGFTINGGTYWQLETVGVAAGGAGPGSYAADRSLDVNQAWFVAGARADLDDNAATTETFVLIDSQNRGPQILNRGQ